MASEQDIFNSETKESDDIFNQVTVAVPHKLTLLYCLDLHSTLVNTFQSCETITKQTGVSVTLARDPMADIQLLNTEFPRNCLSLCCRNTETGELICSIQNLSDKKVVEVKSPNRNEVVTLKCNDEANLVSNTKVTISTLTLVVLIDIGDLDSSTYEVVMKGIETRVFNQMALDFSASLQSRHFGMSQQTIPKQVHPISPCQSNSFDNMPSGTYNDLNQGFFNDRNQGFFNAGQQLYSPNISYASQYDSFSQNPTCMINNERIQRRSVACCQFCGANNNARYCEGCNRSNVPQSVNCFDHPMVSPGSHGMIDRRGPNVHVQATSAALNFNSRNMCVTPLSPADRFQEHTGHMNWHNYTPNGELPIASPIGGHDRQSNYVNTHPYSEDTPHDFNEHDIGAYMHKMNPP